MSALSVVACMLRSYSNSLEFRWFIISYRLKLNLQCCSSIDAKECTYKTLTIYSCRVRSNPYGHNKRGQESGRALLLKEQTGVPPVQGSRSVCDNVAFSMPLQVTCDLHVWRHALVCLAKARLGKLRESATPLDTRNSHIPDALGKSHIGFWPLFPLLKVKKEAKVEKWWPLFQARPVFF